MSVVDLARFMDDLAAASGQAILPFFRAAFGMDDKARGGAAFDPVTEADRAAEVAMRGMIRRDLPTHGILGEEFGSENLDAECVWVLDPIDGTRAFVAGLPTWGTLIGLTHHGAAVRGLMHQPYLGELFSGDGAQARLRSPRGARTLLSRRGTALDQAVLAPPTRACSPTERSASASATWRTACASPATAPTATPTACWRPGRSIWWSRPGSSPTTSSR
jgi:fructose-1,6-bisphosphatase/inositol monophosphatase family enzyme